MSQRHRTCSAAPQQACVAARAAFTVQRRNGAHFGSAAREPSMPSRAS